MFFRFRSDDGTHLVSLWFDQCSFEFVWFCLDFLCYFREMSFGFVCIHLRLFVFVWVHLDSFVFVRIRLGSFVYVWVPLNSFEFV